MSQPLNERSYQATKYRSWDKTKKVMTDFLQI